MENVGLLVILGLAVVFAGLITLWLVLASAGKVTAKKAEAPKPVAPKAASGSEEEIIAAIAASIYLERKDFANSNDGFQLVERVTRPYSPWFVSNKIKMIQDNATFSRWRR